MQRASPARLLFVVVLTTLTTLLSACGFQLRGSSMPLKMSTIALSLSPQSELYGLLRQKIDASGTTRVVAEAKNAEAVFTVLGDSNGKSIQSLSAAGRAREYQLTRTFSFKVESPTGGVYIAPSIITVQRSMNFSDEQVLAKEAEETLLARDMQDDLVRQIMRRLGAAKLKPGSDTETAEK
jgi:LPS-assembly lipoprotein